jgi:hypothetical protein
MTATTATSLASAKAARNRSGPGPKGWAGSVHPFADSCEAMQTFRPTAQGEFADRLNELPKHVVSSALTDPAGNATILGDDWPEAVAMLRKELDGRDRRPMAAAVSRTR